MIRERCERGGRRPRTLAALGAVTVTLGVSLVASIPSAASTVILSQEWEHGLASETPSATENDPLTGKPNQWLVFSGGFPEVGGAHTEGPGQGTQDTEQVGNDGRSGWPAAVKFFGDGGAETSDTPASDRHNLWHVQLEPQNVSINPFIASNLISLPSGDTTSLPAPPNGKNVAWFGAPSSGTFCGTLEEVEANPPNKEAISKSEKNGCTTKIDEEEKPLGGAGAGGTVEEGELVSPPFSLEGQASAALHFNSWFEIEGVEANLFDVMEIDYTTDEGTATDPFKWHEAGTLNPANNTGGESFENFTDEGRNTLGGWRPVLVNLTPAAGSAHVRVRFVFDTWDVLFNGFRGWLIDDVRAVAPSDAVAPELAAVDVCTAGTTPSVTVIRGKNFVVGSKVKLNGTEETAQTPSATRIEIPPIGSGSHTLQVIGPEGLASNEFTVEQPESCASPAIELLPATAEATVGASAEVKATVTEDSGPVKGLAVSFEVAGANPGSGSAATGENGEATFTYVGANKGTDHVVASFVGSGKGTYSSAEVTRTWKPKPASSTTTTVLSGEGKSEQPLTVKEGASVTDQATIAGTNAATATGTVEYNVYSDNACTKSVASAGKVTVSAGKAPASTSETLAPGTYFWQASYSGDENNAASKSACGSETVTVKEPPPSPPPPKLELPQPPAISTKVGSPFAITATVTEGGVAQAGVPVTFRVTGANPQTASIASNSAGQSTFAYTGANTGADHIVASFIDKAGQTVISNEVSETWAAAVVIPSKEEKKTLKDLAAPVLGKTVNVEPVSGIVFIKPPPGATLSRARPWSGLAPVQPLASDALSKGVGFLPLTEARQIPVGSTLDTSEGVVKLQTASATAAKQLGEFSAGIFTVLQARRQKGLINLTIVNTSSKSVCATLGKKAQAAARHLSHKVLGLLKGSAHGKYTTNGTYSAATVRGTIWSVANRCDGTLTAVTRGVVSVRDFARRKTITLRAGQHYLAKAP
jgi:hypothetical protein